MKNIFFIEPEYDIPFEKMSLITTMHHNKNG